MRLTAEALAGARGGRTLFKGLSFTLSRGEALLVRGPNGAGKSTLLRILAGLLPPSRGSARFEGGTLGADAHYLSTQNAMKPALTVEENLAFWHRFLAATRSETAPAPSGAMPVAALEAVGLAHAARLPFGVLSTGQRRRAALARLLLDPRPLWLLDEPALGLDAASQARLAGLMRDHLEGGGLIVAAVHDDPGLPGAAEIGLGEHQGERGAP